MFLQLNDLLVSRESVESPRAQTLHSEYQHAVQLISLLFAETPVDKVLGDHQDLRLHIRVGFELIVRRSRQVPGVWVVFAVGASHEDAHVPCRILEHRGDV